jgi:preprotein translocase SecF subunit
MKPFNVFPYDSHINFMRVRMVSLVIAALLMFAAIGAMAVNGFNFALDFTGGVGVELRFAKPVEVEAVRSRLSAAGYENAQVQSFGTGTDLLVRLQKKEGAAGSNVATSVAQDVKQAASTADNPAEVRSSAEISAQVGKELRDKGILALVFVILGFLIYISFRFEWKFAVAAIITTLHDVVIVVGWFALSGHEFDLTVLAGALSVMGYSVNDTIVVFDRGARELPFHAGLALGSAERLDQPDAVAYRDHLVRGLPDRAGPVHLRWQLAARHGGIADDRHHHRHAVLDLRRLPAADVAGCEQAGPDAEGARRSRPGAPSVSPVTPQQKRPRIARPSFCGPLPEAVQSMAFAYPVATILFCRASQIFRLPATSGRPIRPRVSIGPVERPR